MWQRFIVLLCFVLWLCLTKAHISKRHTSRRCSPADIADITFEAKCHIQTDGDENEVSCSTPAMPRTVAKISCKWGYRRSNGQHIHVSTCGANGHWSPPPTACTQICGEAAAEGTTFIIGGGNANISKVPWHVGIYRKVDETQAFIQQCGGSIISSKVIVTAAHCFWNRNDNRLNPASDYRVAAGKYYRDLYDPRENNTYQTLGIAEIHLDAGYIDYEGLFTSDIAVIVVDNHIEFKPNVAPVCTEPYKYDEKVVPPGSVGRVAGWGLVQSGGDPSETLKEIDLPVIQRDDCLRISDIAFRPFVTSDKFCAGYLSGIGVCLGDSGGGLVFSKTLGENKVNFLRGIVSNGQYKDGSCHKDKYALFTNTAHFHDLIEYHEIANRPAVKEAPKPISTNKCQPIKQNRFGLSECSTNGVHKPCNETTEIGSTITSTCNVGYDTRYPIVHTCVANRDWWPPAFPCNPICGRMTSSTHAPWFARIVSLLANDSNTKSISGVIVSDRVVLTYNIYYANGPNFLSDSVSLIRIFVGSASYSHTNLENNQKVQSRGVIEKMHLFDPNGSDDKTFTILIVDEPFDFNVNDVAPVCFDFSLGVSFANDGAPTGETGVVFAPVYGTNEGVHINGTIKQIYYKILNPSDCDRDLSVDSGRSGIMCAQKPKSLGADTCPIVGHNGFVIPKIENGERVYYLRGIAHTSRGNCHYDKHQVFTNVNYFKHQIQELIKKYREYPEDLVPPNKTCIIFVVPLDGFVSVRGNSTVKLDVGDEVEHLVTIEYFCDIAYYLIGSDSNTCTSGTWLSKVPKCEPNAQQVRCPAQPPPRNGFGFEIQIKNQLSYKFGCDKGFGLSLDSPGQAFCLDGQWVPEIPQNCSPSKVCAPIIGKHQTLSDCQTNGLEKQCSDAVDVGSTVTRTCNDGYKPSARIVHTCHLNGEWWPPAPKCTPICGRTPSLPYVPWLVAVYFFASNSPVPEYPYKICTGVIVSESIVLTTSFYIHPGPPVDVFEEKFSKIAVKAGMFTERFPNWPESTDESDPKQQVRKLIGRYVIPNPIDVDDPSLAVLIVDRPFDFSVSSVAPVCLDFSNSFSPADNEEMAGKSGSVFTVNANGKFAQFIQEIHSDSECKTNSTNHKEYVKGNFCTPCFESFFVHLQSFMGAGFYLPRIEGEETIYYLRGIGRVFLDGFYGERCGNKHVHFSRVNLYKEVIEKYIRDYS